MLFRLASVLVLAATSVVAAPGVVTATTKDSEYIPGTGLRRKLEAPSGSGAQVTLIIGYSADRDPKHCADAVTSNGKSETIDEVILGTANAMAAKAGNTKPLMALNKVPTIDLDGVPAANENAAVGADGGDDGDRRELGNCPCYPGKNCEACCLGLCYPQYDCMAGNHNDPCASGGTRKLSDVTYDNIVDEVRRLDDINSAQSLAEDYQAELKRIAALLVAEGNMCLGFPEDLWVTAEVYESDGSKKSGNTFPDN